VTTNGNTTTTYDASGKVTSRESTSGNTTTIYDAAAGMSDGSPRTLTAKA
jgi:YD repeat-containing protein